MRARVIAAGSVAGWGPRAGRWCTAVVLSIWLPRPHSRHRWCRANRSQLSLRAPRPSPSSRVSRGSQPSLPLLPCLRWWPKRTTPGSCAGNRCARGHTQAQQSDWVSAAQTFTDLARDTGAPADRLAAMRALAQVGHLEEAIDEGERLMGGAQAPAGSDRSASMTKLATLHESNGYRLRRAGAAAHFRRAIDQLPTSVLDEVRAVASGAVPVTASGDASGGPTTSPSGGEPGALPGGTPAASPEGSLRERLRREVREAERTWTLSAFQAWRPRRSAGASGGGAARLQRDGLIAAQGGAELAWRLPGMRSAAGSRETELFARALWSQEDEALAISDRSVQGGVGVRWQPLVGSAWRLTAERLIALGEDARDDWLLRLTLGSHDW